MTFYQIFMEWYVWLIIVLALVLIVIPGIGMLLGVPPFLFKGLFYRKNKDMWSRNSPSDVKNAGILAMWDESLRFRELHKDKEEEISVTTEDGLKLKGLYYDFGGDTAVMVLGGRPESCIYGLYYSYPYAEEGVSICAIDTRAHGESEGGWHGLGYKEQYDVLAFAKYLQEEKGIKKILLHGICVGASTVSFVLAREDCPSVIKGAFVDGMYRDFYSTMKLRIAHSHGPVYPAIWYIRHKAKKLFGFDMKTMCPINNVPHWQVPVTMVASEKDIFSLKKCTQELFNKVGSSDKELLWWPEGIHSHLREIDTKRYDKAVADFIERTKNN